MNIWQRHLSTDTTFCRALVGCGYLTEEQMLRAAARYRLGRSRDGGVIFWQIDASEDIRDGKIMFYRDDCHRDKSLHPTWVTSRLQQHYGTDGGLSGEKCLFGLHLLADYPTPCPSPQKGGELLRLEPAHPESVGTPRPYKGRGWGWGDPIAVVEAEKTAVICSELYPDYLWLAAGGLSMLTAGKLQPLCDRHVVLFPDTDPEGKAFAQWKAVAAEASRQSLYPVYVSHLLEQRATPEQKARKIDLADFLFEHPAPAADG